MAGAGYTTSSIPSLSNLVQSGRVRESWTAKECHLNQLQEHMPRNYMERNTRARAIRQAEFHEALREWFEGAEPGNTIGDTSKRGQTGWVWIRELAHVYQLTADTRYECIGQYLALLNQHEGKLKWGVTKNETTGRENKTVFGPDRRSLRCMYLYRYLG